MTLVENKLWKWLLPLGVGVVAFLTCLPMLNNGFLSWDDTSNIVDNPFFRGLGWIQIKWMFTTFLGGPYQPLSWLSFGWDYHFWGMRPLGYHLTNVLLHASAASLFYLVSVRLLRASQPEIDDDPRLYFGAVFAALFFALHPLRVESVAWTTERRDVLSGCFYLLSLLAYLKAENTSTGTRYRILSIASFGFGLLAKASGLFLPCVLLILDVYPLRRMSASLNSWSFSKTRMILLEKIPYFALSLVAGVAGLYGQKLVGAMSRQDSYGPLERLAMALYGIFFYLWKMVVPLKLSPLYEAPDHAILLSLRFGGPPVFVAALTVLLFVFRRRWPAALACWLSYLLLLIPVLGFVKVGAQLVADRYSYLASLSWSLLGGGVLVSLLHRFKPVTRKVSLIGGGVILGVLAGLTWRQSQAWRSDATLWARAVQSDPTSAVAQDNLGYNLFLQGNSKEAEMHFREAVKLNPKFAFAYNNLGYLLLIQGRFAEAETALRQATLLRSDMAAPMLNLALALHAQRKWLEATAYYQEALIRGADYVAATRGLGEAFSGLGKAAEAERYLRMALQRSPDDVYAHRDLAQLFEATGRQDEAIAEYRQVLRLNPTLH